MKTSRHSRTLIVGMATLCLLLGLALAYGCVSHGVLDGVSEIHDTDTGELLVSLAMYDDGEWVVWTPELLYNASDASELNLVLQTATGMQPLFDRPWMKQPDILQDFLSSLR